MSIIIPASAQSNWFVVVPDPTELDDGDVLSGGVAVRPDLIERPAGFIGQPWIPFNTSGTMLRLRLKYPTAGSPNVAPEIVVFGCDGNAVPERLFDDNEESVLELPFDAANDERDANGFSYGRPVELDLQCNKFFVVCVKTAFDATDESGAAILARYK